MTIETQHLPLFTVSQLSHAIKHCLEGTFPSIQLQGEVSNCKLHSSGHLYFSLKDVNAQISAVMYRPDAATLKTPPKDGIQVIVRGELNVYPPSGKYQIIVRELRPVGLGELLLKLEELKIKLHKMGWFRSDRKKPLPKFPKRIGVVTSPTGAAIQDILNILTRRFSGFHLILNPVRVQGETAAKEIAQAIEQFNTYNLADVLIIGRGGGSFEDLWAFNEEIVAQAIYNSRIPIISAVGHETDHCIADYVADVRAPTPSAAAELVIAEKAHQLTHLDQMQRRMLHTIVQHIRQDKRRLQGLLRLPVFQSPFNLLGPWIQRLDAMRQDIDENVQRTIATQWILIESKRQQLQASKPTAKLEHYRQKLAAWDRSLKLCLLNKFQAWHLSLANANETLKQIWQAKQHQRRTAFQSKQKLRQLDMAWQRLLDQKKERLGNLKNSIDTLNPKNLLSKGYCILFSEKDHSAITSVHDVENQQDVKITLFDGDLLATINNIVPLNEQS